MAGRRIKESLLGITLIDEDFVSDVAVDHARCVGTKSRPSDVPARFFGNKRKAVPCLVPTTIGEPTFRSIR